MSMEEVELKVWYLPKTKDHATTRRLHKKDDVGWEPESDVVVYLTTIDVYLTTVNHDLVSPNLVEVAALSVDG
jgi:hypothetical protein